MIGKSRPRLRIRLISAAVLPSQPLLAPVDDHAADRGVGLHRHFRIVVAPRADHLEAVLLDLADDLVQALALEIAGLVEGGGAQQELEAAGIFHRVPRERTGGTAGAALMPRRVGSSTTDW